MLLEIASLSKAAVIGIYHPYHVLDKHSYLTVAVILQQSSD